MFYILCKVKDAEKNSRSVIMIERPFLLRIIFCLLTSQLFIILWDIQPMT